MAATIGKITAVLTAQTKSFERKLSRSKKFTANFAKGVVKATRRVALFSAAVTAAAVGALAILVQKQRKVIDQLAKTARKLGIATGELQALQIAAEISGIRVETFNMALQRMTRRVSEAAIGTGEAQAALKELGLDAQELMGLPLEEQFKRVADAISRVERQGDRVRLAFKLFDSEGVALVNTLALGRDRMDEISDQLERMGLRLTALDTAKVEAMNDAWTEFRSILSAATQKVVVGLAPALTAIIEGITGALEGEGALGDRILGTIDDIVDRMAGFVGLIVAAISSVDKLADKFAKMTGVGSGVLFDIFEVSLAQALANLPGVGDDIAAFMGKANEEADKFRLQIDKIIEDIRNALATAGGDGGGGGDGRLPLLAAIEGLNAALQKQIETFGKTTEEVRLYELALRGATDAELARTRALIERLKALRDQKALEERLRARAERIEEMVRTPMERFQKQMEELRELLSRGFIDQDVFEKARKQFREELLGGGDRVGEGQQVRLSRVALTGVKTPAQKRTEDLLERIMALMAKIDTNLNDGVPVDVSWN